MVKQALPTSAALPVLMISCTKEEIGALLREIVKEEMQATKLQELQEKLYSRKEIAKLLGVSEVTVTNWGREGRINEHRIGHRVYYKHSEIMASLQTLKRYRRA